MTAHTASTVLQMPDTVLARLRAMFLAGALINALILWVVIFWTDEAAWPLPMTGAAALLLLTSWWILGHVRARFPVAALPAEGVALLFVVAATHNPTLALGLLYLGLCFRSLYGSNRSVLVLALTYALAYAGAGLLASPDALDREGLQILILELSGLTVAAAPRHLLARTLGSLDGAPAWEQTLAGVSATLSTAHDRAALFRGAVDAAHALAGDATGVATTLSIGSGSNRVVVAGAGASAGNAGVVLEQAVTVHGQPWGVLAVRASSRLPEGCGPGLSIIADELALALAREQLDDDLRGSEGLLRALMLNVSDVIAVFTPDWQVRYVSPSVEQVLGYTPEELRGQHGAILLHPDDIERFRRFMFPPSGEISGTLELRLRHKQGNWRTGEVTASNLVHNPDVQGIVVAARDITERREFEAQLAVQAHMDQLTGLPNRTLFMERLERALTADQPGCTAVLFLDLDGFKHVNDSLGHAVGDELLISVAKRLTQGRRADDLVSRFGGDEFTILLENCGSPEGAVRAGERVIEALRQPFALAGRDIWMTVSVGVATTGDCDGLELGSACSRDLLREADTALYRAKSAGRDRVVLYDENMNAGSVAKIDLDTDLRRAIDRGELRVYYQPLIDLHSRAVVGAEALVRWQHPDRGMVPPNEFIPHAEDSGLILSIGAWVMREACIQARAWQDMQPEGTEPLIIAVNISAREFQCPAMVPEVFSILKETGLPPSSLEIEITERTVMNDVETAASTIRALKAHGVRIAIDDFGTGYSSLSYLHRFDVDRLKVDQSFVRDIVEDPSARAVVDAVVAMARALGMEVTAEGVETELQLGRLAAARCGWGQGYLFGRPSPPEVLTEYIVRSWDGDATDEADVSAA